MPYLTQQDLEANIPAPFLVDALDDDGDRQIDPDVLDGVLDSASRSVDAVLGQRYGVPFPDPPPVIAVRAAVAFAAQLCYQRRGISPEQNPWSREAGRWHKKLSAIAAGDEPLAPAEERAAPSASAITEPSRLHSRRTMA